MALQIENITTVQREKQMLNYADITVNNFKFSVPYFCASSRDYDKSRNCGIDLDSKIFQFFVDVTNSNARLLTDPDRQQSIIDRFNSFVNSFKPKFSDVTFYADGHSIDTNIRDAILNLQQRMNIPFLNDIQLYREQEMPEFIQQINSFLNFSSNKIKSPTISLKMPPELFSKKLNYLIEQKFMRINLEWGGEQSSDENWITVSKISKTNAVWFNCVAIIQRRKYSDPFDSNVMRAFKRGVHTCALATLAYPQSDTKPLNKKKWIFNNVSDCYLKTYNGTPDSNDTNSHNLLFNKMLESHKGIKNQDYFNTVP